MVQNYRHIKRNVVTVVNGPIDRTDTYDGPIPTGITTSFHSSSLTTKPCIIPLVVIMIVITLALSLVHQSWLLWDWF